jgi:hypothetical protein
MARDLAVGTKKARANNHSGRVANKQHKRINFDQNIDIRIKYDINESAYIQIRCFSFKGQPI